jgi:hypothetical protein
VGSSRAQFRAQPPILGSFTDNGLVPETRVGGGFEVARPAGFEPATYGLEVRCSIQLSYGRINLILKYLTPHRPVGSRKPV